MKTILVVDDETKILQLARDYLQYAGFTVLTADAGKTALAVVRIHKPNLIVLDLGLPDIDGLDVTRTLRKESNVPIIMLTARGEESDKLVGLELGADDYLTKPFSPKELVARVRAVLRRAETTPAAEELIRLGEITLDVPRMRVMRGEQPVELTRPNLSYWPRWPANRGVSSPAPNCSTPCMASPLSRMSGPLTPTSKIFAASWSLTRANRATC